MLGVDQTLLIRALNSTRQVYFPSYVGLRLIGSQLSSGENDYLQKLVLRRLMAGDAWRFKTFKLYKGSIQSSQGHDHQYRDCLAPSPLTAIAESFILKKLSESPAFDVSPRVFSYRWPPSSQSGVSYRYFFDGYKQRNNEIAAALDTPNQVAIVTDLKKFYPSAKKGQVESALKSHLAKCDKQLGVLGEGIFEFYSQLLTAGGDGIPIGPASGHVLGQLVLHDVDTILIGKYGNKYFRYVDDIVIVCNENDVDTATQDIKDCIEYHGFAINAEKTMITSGVEWHHNMLRSDVSEDDNIRLLSSDLAAYLAFHPGRADELKRIFSDAGLSIPVGRLLALSKYSRFRYFLLRKKAFSLFFATNVDFLERGLRLKKAYERALSELIGLPSESSPNLRRWQVQRTRRVINSLFYLRNFNEWVSRPGTFEAFPELIEQQALARALSSGTVNPILPFYGSGPAAFSELWAEHGHGDASLMPGETGLNVAEVDGLITLRLHGTIPADAVQLQKSTEDLRLLGVVNRNSLIRSLPDLSFEDEFESLCLGVTDQEISTLARTRYSLSEGSVLEALSLLSSEYRS